MVLQDSPRVSRQGIERAGAVRVAAVHGEVGGGESGEKSGIAQRQYLRKFHLCVTKKVSSSFGKQRLFSLFFGKIDVSFLKTSPRHVRLQRPHGVLRLLQHPHHRVPPLHVLLRRRQPESRPPRVGPEQVPPLPVLLALGAVAAKVGDLRGDAVVLVALKNETEQFY